MSVLLVVRTVWSFNSNRTAGHEPSTSSSIRPESSIVVGGGGGGGDGGGGGSGGGGGAAPACVAGRRGRWCGAGGGGAGAGSRRCARLAKRHAIGTDRDGYGSFLSGVRRRFDLDRGVAASGRGPQRQPCGVGRGRPVAGAVRANVHGGLARRWTRASRTAPRSGISHGAPCCATSACCSAIGETRLPQNRLGVRIHPICDGAVSLSRLPRQNLDPRRRDRCGPAALAGDGHLDFTGSPGRAETRYSVRRWTPGIARRSGR